MGLIVALAPSSSFNAKNAIDFVQINSVAPSALREECTVLWLTSNPRRI
jgi:hypothetical protein